MNRFLLAPFALAIATPSLAADLPTSKGPPIAPEVPVFTWTGPYVGVNAGGGWENTQTSYSYTSIPAPAPPGFEDVFGPGGPLNVGGASAVASAIAIGFIPTSLGNRSSGFFTGGAQLGYNEQINQIVFGGETDFDWVANGVRTTTFSAPPNGVITNNDVATAGIRWLGTARGRLGYAYDRALFFATGGLAYAQVNSTGASSNFDGANTDLFFGSGSGMRAGYAVGGGVEYAFTNNLSAKLEYIYYNLGSTNYAVAPANAVAAGEGIFITAHQRFDGNIVRAGLNYRFDWSNPIAARY